MSSTIEGRLKNSTLPPLDDSTAVSAVWATMSRTDEAWYGLPLSCAAFTSMALRAASLTLKLGVPTSSSQPPARTRGSDPTHVSFGLTGECITPAPYLHTEASGTC